MGVSVPVKYFVLTTASLLMTLLCFWLMQLLISAEISRMPDIATPKITTPLLSPLRKTKEPEVRRRAKKVMSSELPPQSEGNPLPTQTKVLTKSRYPIRASLSEILGSEQIPVNLTPPTKDLVPLFMVHPVYPFVAVVRGIEGFVTVQFSVRENGSVTDAIVVESEPRSLFDDAALSAVRKFKFQPREVGGDPMPVEAMRMRFAFTLESPYAS